jgi:hypothetical protein
MIPGHGSKSEEGISRTAIKLIREGNNGMTGARRLGRNDRSKNSDLHDASSGASTVQNTRLLGSGVAACD